jgi:hypothetical protein
LKLENVGVFCGRKAPLLGPKKLWKTVEEKLQTICIRRCKFTKGHLGTVGPFDNGKMLTYSQAAD